MTTKQDEIKGYLTDILKTSTLTNEERTSIEGTIAFFEKEKDGHQELWEKFIETMEKKVTELNQNVPIEGYAFETCVNTVPGLFSWSLYLKNEDNSFIVLNVNSFSEHPNRLYFSDASEEDEVEMSSFDELETAINLSLQDETFYEFIEGIKEFITDQKNA